MNVSLRTPPPVIKQPQRVEHRSAGYGCDFQAVKETAKISSGYGAIGAIGGYFAGALISKCQIAYAFLGIPLGFASLACPVATFIGISSHCECVKKLPERQIAICTEPVSYTGDKQQSSEQPSVSSPPFWDPNSMAPPPYPGDGFICIDPSSYSFVCSKCTAPVRSQPGLESSSFNDPSRQVFEPPFEPPLVSWEVDQQGAIS